ncbi:MAG: LPS export ABC transporter permease LptF [Candidatus Aminicenantes bacterium]|nr:LPS export ABC transporter permease LptF [Candidatus Aminicenantes bacterium]
MITFFDRYVLREFIPPFFIGLIAYTFVVLMNHILQLSEIFITRGVAFGAVLKILIYLIPSLLAFTVPMSVLMGILAGLSRLSADSEITAFKTLGISYKRLLSPVFVFSVLGWLFTGLLTLYLAPMANYKWVQSFNHAIRETIQYTIRPREFNESLPQAVLYIQDIDQKHRWKNIFVYFTQPADESRFILAEEGSLSFYPDKKKAVLRLSKGVIHSTRLSEPEKYSLTSFENFVEALDIESAVMRSRRGKGVREKNIVELFRDLTPVENEKARIEKEIIGLLKTAERQKDPRLSELSFKLRGEKMRVVSHRVEINKRFAFPFACLIFGILALPLGASTRRGGRTGSFTLSVGITLLYYILITAGEKLAMDGRISPFLGIWAANILFAGLGVYLFVGSLREWSLPSFMTRFFSWIRSWLLRRERRVSYRPGFRLFLRFPNILDRYILRKYFIIFFLVVCSLLSISIIVTFFERIGAIYEHDKPLFMLVEFIWYQLPEFIYLIFPVGALATSLLSLGLLTKFNEITAMKACGISLYRVIVPVLLVSVVISFCSYYTQENILPQANRKAEEVWHRINDIPPRTFRYMDRRWVMSQKKDRVYHYQYFDEKDSVFSRISLFDIDFEKWTLRQRIQAEKGRLEGTDLTLIDGWRREFQQNEPVLYERIEKKRLTGVEDKGYFVKEIKEPSQMSYRELQKYIEEIKQKDFETAQFEVDLKYKISFPLAAFIMTLIAIPFAFSMGKRGTLAGIGLSIVFAMVYWGAIGIFKNLGYTGYASIFFAAWGPNLIFGLLGLYLLFRLRT